MKRIDSEITLQAVQQCQTNGIAVLPVHDSLIVPARYVIKRRKSWRRRLRHDPRRTCEVRIKDKSQETPPEPLQAA